MTPPSWKLERLLTLALASGLGIIGCTDQVAASFPTATQHPDGERRPDGIAVDLTSEPPPWLDRADADDNIVTLRAPLGTEAAFRVVHGFFDSAFREDINAMAEVVPQTTLLYDLKNTATVQPANAIWRQRFYKYEYQQLAASLVYRESDVMTYHSEQLDTLPLAVRDLDPSTPVDNTDIVLRVPIVTPSIKNERYFGDEIYFWLRREGDRYVVFRMAEDVPL